MRKSLAAALIVLLFFWGRVEGQVANYVFTASGGTFTNISSNEIFDLQDDDELTSAIPIGFNFVYNGTTYSQVQACSNGWLSFVASQTNAYWDNTLSNSNTIRPALYPLWDDLDGFWEGQNFYGTSGSFPNRVFTFEWRTFDWQVFAFDDVISFQVKLYETSNIIQFIYQQGTESPYNPSATIGISGTTSGDYLTLNNSTSSPTASFSTFTTNINASPANGQIYQFAPPACSGTPPGGTTVSTATPVCANTNFTLSVTGSAFVSGLTYQWESSPNGSTWTNIGGATSATYTTSIATSTWFRRKTICVGTGTSSNLQVVVNTPLTTVTPGNVCINLSSVLTATAAAGSSTLISENFNGVAAGWTTVNNSTGGSNPANAAWTLRPDGYQNTGGTTVYTFHSNDNSQFYLTNADAVGSGGPTVSTILQSPSFSTTGYTSVSLQFYHHFKYLASSNGKVDISTNGSTWTTLQTYSGSDHGSSNSFVSATINLPAGFVNQPTVYIRFKFDAAWDWFWAVDNVTITGIPSTVNYSWTVSPTTGAGLPVAAGTPSAANNSITVTPTVPGIFAYTVTSSNTCLAPASVNVTATVGSIVSSSACASLTAAPGDNYFISGSCNLMAKVTPQGPVPVSGTVSTCVTFDGTVQAYNGQPYVQRHYDIEPAVNANNSTARITLYATQAEFDAVNFYDAGLGDNWPDLPTWWGDAPGIAAVKVTQWHGTPTSSPSSPGNYTDPYAVLLYPVSVTWNNPETRWEIVLDIVGFSGFYIHTGYGYPLPALLVNFNGHRENGYNRLNWQVATEQNISGYSLERSIDGRNFTAIGFLSSLAPGGNSTDALKYHFVDNNLNGDKQYYRLKQISIDGRIKISPVVLIKSVTTSSLVLSRVFPNPVSEQVNMGIESPGRNELTILMSDISGRILQTRKIIVEQGSTVISFNTEQLAAGTYLLKVVCSSGCEEAISKFIKQ